MWSLIYSSPTCLLYQEKCCILEASLYTEWSKIPQGPPWWVWGNGVWSRQKRTLGGTSPLWKKAGLVSWACLQDDQARASHCPVLQESRGSCLILPATVCGNICELPPTREVHPSFGTQGSYWGSVMQAWNTRVTDLIPTQSPSFQRSNWYSAAENPRHSKTGIHHKSHW